MSSLSTINRRKQKETNPEKYQEYLQKQREASKKRREEERKIFEGQPTRAQIEERDQKMKAKRERMRANYYRKKAEDSRQTCTSAEAGAPTSTQKKQKDMSAEEFRHYKTEMKRKHRATLNHQKKHALKVKDREKKREKKDTERQMQLRVFAKTPASSGQLRQAIYNLNHEYKKKTKELGTQYARSALNLLNPKSLEKRVAIQQEQGSHSCRSLFVKEPQTNYNMEDELSIQLEDAPVLGATTANEDEEEISNPLHFNIQLFYCRDDISRLLPHSRSSTKNEPARVLTMTVKNAHSKFLEESGAGQVGLTLFQRLRPRNVRLLGSVPLESCLCIYCKNVRLKLDVLNLVLGSSSKLPPESALFGFITCPFEGRWPRKECIDGECPFCSDRIRPFKVVCRDVYYVDDIQWKRWERNNAGKVELMEKKGAVKDLIEELYQDLAEPMEGTSFLQHIFTAFWQYSQFKSCKINPEEGEVIMVQDFGENRKAAYSSEIKSAHFGKRQITVHPVVCFLRVGEDVIKENHIFLTDDIQHDHHAVREFTARSLDIITNRMTLRKVTMWSDGVASQYKARGTFHDLSVMTGYDVQRCYFGSEHGKGETDGETGLISQALKRAVYQGHSFSNAAEMVAYLSAHHGGPKRKYILVNGIDRMAADGVSAIPGTKKLHQFQKLAPFVVQTRKLACFCTACREGRHARCSNVDIVGEFTIHKLRPAYRMRNSLRNPKEEPEACSQANPCEEIVEN